ncbi:Protein of unknown function [Micromonospora rhizosphaerae]|uniref:DUF998 domain-containing protein n=1 Tax=Micromonospora rhizosphaerae TaxID=568872 RepID=A0A1C6TDA2_9ACTN|nr:DUF998 domain-containing protein [Micromonospora rhizosphaerae]SCL39483.1 Protein of unknown function [Micromonospora rhizosphaerae]
MSRLGAARALPAVALGLAAVLYASWLLGPLLNPSLGLLDGYASELAARDQPYHLVFRLADLVTGVLAAATGVALARRARGWLRRAWWGLIAFGVMTGLDGTVTSLDCATTTDVRCGRLEELGELSLRHAAHKFTSSLAIAGVVLSLLALLAALRGARFRWGLLVAAVLLVGTAGTMAEAVRPDALLGAWQRVQLLGVSGWLLLAAAVARPPRSGTDPPPGAGVTTAAGRDTGS